MSLRWFWLEHEFAQERNALQKVVSMDGDLGVTMKVEPEGRRQLKGGSEASVKAEGLGGISM